MLDSVKKTGRAIVVHESMMNAGVGAEVAATIQEKAFLRLEAPVKRVTGWATHTGLVFEKFIIPDVTSKFSRLCLQAVEYLLTDLGVYDAIKQILDY